jgi:hypothetical protein
LACSGTDLALALAFLVSNIFISVPSQRRLRENNQYIPVGIGGEEYKTLAGRGWYETAGSVGRSDCSC